MGEAQDNKKQMAKKVIEQPMVSDQVDAFFKLHPKAPSVLVVGEQLFFAHHKGAAQDCANRNGCKVETVENPDLGAQEETEKN